MDINEIVQKLQDAYDNTSINYSKEELIGEFQTIIIRLDNAIDRIQKKWDKKSSQSPVVKGLTDNFEVLEEIYELEIAIIGDFSSQISNLNLTQQTHCQKLNLYREFVTEVDKSCRADKYQVGGIFTKSDKTISNIKPEFDVFFNQFVESHRNLFLAISMYYHEHVDSLIVDRIKKILTMMILLRGWQVL